MIVPGVPRPDQVKAWRQERQLTAKSAAGLVYVAQRTWFSWEMGDRAMPAGLWELAQIKAGPLGK